MIPAFIIAATLLLVAVIIMLALVLRRAKGTDLSPLMTRLQIVEASQKQFEGSLKQEFANNRQELASQSHDLRTEVQLAIKTSTDSLVHSVNGISTAQQNRLEDFAKQLNALTQTEEASVSQVRLELSDSLNKVKEAQEKRLSDNALLLKQEFRSFGSLLSEFGKANQEAASQTRKELSTTLKDFKDSLQKQTAEMVGLQKQQFDSFATQLAALVDKSDRKSDELRTSVEGKLTELQHENSLKLDEMRQTVDEKLQSTLDRRLGESFRQVSDRLEQVHKGLGEMQTLATGVGDLKRVLTNIKTRGTWGEIQLGNLLEQVLTTDQFGRNVKTKPTEASTVEFAIKLPGPDEDESKTVWLPIDAKFPKEDYERLVDAAERCDAAGVEEAGHDLELRVRSEARDIRDKYLSPPDTTDFGLLYLPIESLYAEVLRRPGLVDSLQREQRVVIVGPTTLAALLNSLQMGFHTLAIQKRSSEVWKVLGAVKTQFGKFGDLLQKVKVKLDETGDTIEDAVHRSRQIEKKLRKVEALPADEATALLTEGHAADAEDEPVETPQ